jgi:hypothetical protein
VASAFTSSESRLVSASTPTSTSTTETRRRERARSLSRPQHCCGPCVHPQHPRLGTCTARRKLSSSKRPFSRLKARHPACTILAARGTTATLGTGKRLSTRTARQDKRPTWAERRSMSESLTCADKPRTATLTTSLTPDVQATQRHGRRQATTRDGVGVTTAARIAHRRRSPQGPVCSARRSAR